MTYTGRFAPSPTGPLHLGSLVAAVGSYLDARAHEGTWLVRMEDLDPPRELPEAKQIIPQQLSDHGLHWDNEIVYQSDRLDLYQSTLEQLKQRDLLFTCHCSRQRIRSIGGIYDGHCRKDNNLDQSDIAVRIKIDQSVGWHDLFVGEQLFSPEKLQGDFIVKRRDGLFSYQLAVAIDDHLQKITHVIRGADLLDSTARQIHIHQSLNLSSPIYGHLPLVLGTDGHKLSKQTHAAPLNPEKTSDNLVYSLNALGQNAPPELKLENPSSILQWGIKHWDRSLVPVNTNNLNV